MAPSPSGRNGRGRIGRFAAGNRFGAGNPHASKVQKLRAAMLSVITEKNVADIVLTLTEMAISGDLKAAKMILDLVGSPEDAVSAAPEVNKENFEEIKRELLARTN